ncbi:polysaccharide deacetylase family protein [Streptococcus sp. DD13]|uniref:polysaccharide deacetylase family protein n=1 Tax=Streptococcus sp. DD13 TaxID=1777881 RepID=UPI00079A14B5|nr:polysaccharide deacetylase family protein [Streptococcus sp. DD13]KXT78383.1 Peptidoglycan N-acetylglucosamine deacetylase [Streptococcus sp. DD13]
MLRKNTFIILFDIIAFIVLVFTAYQLYTVWQTHQVETYLSSRQEELAGDQTVRQEGKVGTTYVTAYIPKNKANEEIPALKEIILSQVHADLGQTKPKDKVTDFYYITAQTTSSDLKDITAYQLVSVKDQKKGQSIEKGERVTHSPVYFTSNMKRFSFADLFEHTDLAQEVLLTRIQEELNKTSLSDTDKQEKLAQAKQLKLADLDFTYKDSQLVISLPEKTVGLATVQIPIGQLFDCIHSQYLTDKDQTSYQQAQEIKRQQEAQANAGGGEKVIALTFDDGPSAETTPGLLDILKKYQVKATFFIVGKHVAGNEAILKRELAEGHELSNHSWSHPNLLELSTSDAVAEITKTQEAIKGATGYTPKNFRPPYGNVNQAILNALDIPAIYWSVDSEDWKSHSTPAIMSQVKAQSAPGGIILMHDIHATSVAAVPQVIEYLKSQGYRFVTVSELYGNKLKKGKIYYDRQNYGPASQ